MSTGLYKREWALKTLSLQLDTISLNQLYTYSEILCNSNRLYTSTTHKMTSKLPQYHFKGLGSHTVHMQVTDQSSLSSIFTKDRKNTQNFDGHFLFGLVLRRIELLPKSLKWMGSFCIVFLASKMDVCCCCKCWKRIWGVCELPTGKCFSHGKRDGPSRTVNNGVVQVKWFKVREHRCPKITFRHSGQKGGGHVQANVIYKYSSPSSFQF